MKGEKKRGKKGGGVDKSGSEVEVKQSGGGRAVDEEGRGGKGARKQRRGRKEESDTSANREGGREARVQQGGDERKGGKGKKDKKKNRRSGRQAFPPHMEVSYAREAISRGLLVEGWLRVNAKKPSDAFVVCPDLEEDVLIKGHRHRNRAMHGDTVAVALLPQSEWVERGGGIVEKMAELAVDDDGSSTDSNAEEGSTVQGGYTSGEEGETKRAAVDDKERRVGKVQPTGVIVSILEVNPNRRFVGVLEEEVRRERDVRFILKPATPLLPLLSISIPIGQAPTAEEGRSHLYEARMIGWGSEQWHPVGRLESNVALGAAGEVEAETEALLRTNNVNSANFAADVLACLPPNPSAWSVPEEELPGAAEIASKWKKMERKDLRSSRIFTIDPLTARDLDDALSCKVIGEDLYEVGVHIADVSHFVRRGTALDKEAQRRSTTVYLMQKAVPMLPRVLCENLCSLHEDVERLAFSVVWKIKEDGTVVDRWFGRTIIKSCAKLSYEDAQTVIEGYKQGKADAECNLPRRVKTKGHSREEVEGDILAMHRIAANMRRKRYERGALSLEKQKLAFKLDDSGFPVEFRSYERKEAHFLVEEFMLLANMSVAERISHSFPHASLLRRHSQPKDDMMGDFVKLCSSLGMNVDASSSRALHDSLQSIRAQMGVNVYDVVNYLATKPMNLAEYFCTADADEKDWKHFALSVERYTHFTSPIRRYADVVVHRLLEAALRAETISEEEEGSRTAFQHLDEIEKELVFPPHELKYAAVYMNEKKESAKKAQEASEKLFLCMYLRKAPATVDGLVHHVGEKCVRVFIPICGVDKTVYYDKLDEAAIVTFSSDPPHAEVKLPSLEASCAFSMFDSVKVRLSVREGTFPLDFDATLIL
mmetsp:Transcript_46210/g.119078  ORF Transcript_46210/g.119078 Transcript_46210/m.119078 type:complete len:880 (-) Transcript_46210:89-2728(-)